MIRLIGVVLCIYSLIFIVIHHANVKHTTAALGGGHAHQVQMEPPSSQPHRAADEVCLSLHMTESNWDD